ncbi:MAG: hypothetical protein M1832_001209 [Thelocarpon impressellum]|nr:MAG: hypothetical protein M1832_001209 [Thelocarpon impressellum]
MAATTTGLLRCLHRRPLISLTRPSPTSTAFIAKAFSTTPITQASKRIRPDKRITLIRYHLSHPLTPRPLRLSRLRALRHWTVHRAWQVHRAAQRVARERELERMYNSMRDACDALRLLEGDGGSLYRRAMVKKGVFGPGGWPVEATRLQTEWPARVAWQGGWKR